MTVLALAHDISKDATTPQTRVVARGLVLAGALTATGLLLVGFVAHLAVFSRLSEARDQTVLRHQLTREIQAGVVPDHRGAPVAELVVPRLALDAVVVEGTRAGDLVHGPGHRTSTPLPGQAGLAVVAGRRLAYGGPFAHLDRLRLGDEVRTLTGLGTATFRVDDISRSSVPKHLPPGAVRLQLITGDPAWTPRRALVVNAVLVSGPALPAPAGLPLPSADELALNDDPAALFPVAALAGGLLGLCVLLAWAWQRLPRPIIWVGGLPTVLAVLWQLSDSLARLLPGTL